MTSPFHASLSFKPVDIIDSYQNQKLQETLRYLEHLSPYYQRLFKEHNIDIAAINAVTDLQSLPCTTKEDFNTRNQEFLCIPASQIADISATSGTSGQPSQVALSAKDLARLAYNEAQSFALTGSKAGDRVQLLLTLDRQFMAGIAYYSGLQLLGATTIRTGPGSPAMQWDSIYRYKPDTLVSVPSFLLLMIAYARENKIELNQSSIKKVVCIGESIRNADGSNNALSTQILKAWEISLYATYASSEMQTAYTECTHHLGLHQQPDLIITEVLDENGKQVIEGEIGEVTITSIGVEAMPLLRYRTGDLCAYIDSPCTCGRNTRRLSPVVGRKNQMIKYKGTTLYPPAIYDVLKAKTWIKDYVIVVSQTEIEIDQLTIYYTTDNDMDEAEYAKLKSQFQSQLKVSPKFQLTTDSYLRSLRPDDSRKQVNIVFQR